jgi:hypothetical protein
MLAQKLKKEIEVLPIKVLEEAEDFIRALKIKKGKAKKQYNVFDVISDSAMDVGIKDLARNHDRYLYGTHKK